MSTVLIVKMGATFPSLAKRRGDFEDWVADRLGIAPGRMRIAKPYAGETLPDPFPLSGVVVTGSHAMVTEKESWSERTAKWLSHLVKTGTPLLGICYGHQLLAHAMGGRVGFNPVGGEFGIVGVRLCPQAGRDRLFSGFPASLRVYACHAQSVLTLPPRATLLAASDADPHHAFRVGDAAWGVQFHPEFDDGIMNFYLEEFADRSSAGEMAPDGRLDFTANTGHGAAVLKRFGEIINESD